MKEYLLKDIHIGLNHSFNVVITSKMMSMFEEITGDNNPLHTKEEFALTRGFQNKVVYGMLTSAFYSTLVGVYIPGKNALFHGLDVSFTTPVFPGDTLTVYGEVVAVYEIHKQIEIKGTITNQFGKKVSRAKIRTGVYE